MSWACATLTFSWYDISFILSRLLLNFVLRFTDLPDLQQDLHVNQHSNGVHRRLQHIYVSLIKQVAPRTIELASGFVGLPHCMAHSSTLYKGALGLTKEHRELP